MLGRHGRTAGIAAKPLEPEAVVGGDADIGMDAEAGNSGTAPSGREREIFRFDPVAGPGYAAPGTRHRKCHVSAADWVLVILHRSALRCNTLTVRLFRYSWRPVVLVADLVCVAWGIRLHIN